VKNFIEQISHHLFADKRANVYAVLDGAMIPGLLPKLYEYQPEYECLYRGELAPDIAEVAPYLVRIESGNHFTNWILEHGWGKNWGIFATSAADLRQMRRHFRTFLIVHDEKGAPLYFRYYDPRVLRVFLPTCDAEELWKMFGSVISYVLEDEDSNKALRFRIESNSLRQEKAQLV
jgi:hypothetical protein